MKNLLRLNHMIHLLAILLVGLLTGCNEDKSTEKIREVSNIQAQEASRNGIAAEREYFDSRAKAAEADLEKRQRFYQGTAGTYEGTIVVNKSNFKIRITLTQSLPRYVPTDRVRTWEEVTADITGLYFNVQVVQWNPESNYSAVGCLISNVRPDLIKGEINIASEGCPNFYNLGLSDENSADGEVDYQIASVLAGSLLDGKLEKIEQIRGIMRPTSNASVYTFVVNRTK